MAILINDTTPRSQYTATSGQTVFTVPFEFFENSDLKVYKNSTLLTLTTNYTVTGAGVTGGGSITLVSGATAGDIVTIVRDVPVKRVTDFPTSGPFNVDALNSDLDRLTAMVQQQEALDSRSLRLDQFDTPNTLNTLPAKADRIGRVLQFNSSTGQPEAGPTTSEVANAQTYATNASTSATAAAASASTASSAASSTAASVAAAAASASAASTSATNSASSASAASTSASNASTSASNASTSATAASGSASTAATQATNAASSASAASTSASNASTSATNAASAQTAAESARDATLAAYDSFDDRYLGTKTSNPTLDNDGNALLAGALYFNSVAGEMRLYTGSAWVAAYVSGSGFLALSGGTLTGPLNAAAGTVSAPSISTSGDSNTGIYFPAADTIAFTEGGVEAMRIDSSGSVAIGVTDPATYGTFAVYGGATATSRQVIISPNSTSYNGQLSFLRLGTTVWNVGIDQADSNKFKIANSGTYSLSSGTAMTIDGSSNVGIGTSAPAASLSVLKQTTALSGTGNSYGLYMYPTSSGLTYIDAITGSSNNTALTLRTYNNGTYNTFAMDNGGNVTASGYISDKIGNVRSVPQNSQTTGYTLVALDAGKHISITTGGVTVPSGVFAIGDSVTIYNNSSSNQTITQGGSVTMYLVGTATTGNRTLAQRGLCTVFCVASNTFVITGGGLT